MVMVESAIFRGGNASYLLLINKIKRNTTIFSINALAKKRNNLSENSSSTAQERSLQSKVISTTFLAQSATAVFALGFIDAGYSGDWSRIGVISKESEDLLKLAAFLVVPFCFFLVFWLSRKSDD